MGIVLVGFMGTGKNTVGRLLSGRLGWPLVDTDALIEERAGKPIPRIFQEDGEAVFREWETAVLTDLATAGVAPRVVAAGGGVVLAERNWPLLRALGRVVCLTADPQTIQRRVGGASGRPLLDGPPDVVRRRIEDLLAQRRDAYARADHCLDTSHLTPEQAAAHIAAAWAKSAAEHER